MIVMFAELCDVCGVRSEEYTAHNRCRECECDLCPACTVEGTFLDGEEYDNADGYAVKRRDSGICAACFALEGAA